MSESDLSFLSKAEGLRIMRQLDDEARAELKGMSEVDSRADAANVISLLMANSEVFVVNVVPSDPESMPFTLNVGRADALQAYRHPYGYVGRSAA